MIFLNVNKPLLQHKYTTTQINLKFDFLPSEIADYVEHLIQNF